MRNRFILAAFAVAFGSILANSADVENPLPTGTSGHVVPYLDGINTWSALQSYSATDAALLSLKNVTNSIDTTIGYSTVGAATGRELIIINNQFSYNTLALRNASNTGYSAIAMRDDTGVEKSAFGYGNSGSSGPWATNTYVEAQSGLIFAQSTTIANFGGAGTYTRQKFDTAGDIIFYAGAAGATANLTLDHALGGTLAGDLILNKSGGTSAIKISGNGNILQMRNDGTGAAHVELYSQNGSINFGTNGGYAWTINNSRHLIAAADNVYDIGASGATRPRNVYVAGTGNFAGNLATASTTDSTTTTSGALQSAGGLAVLKRVFFGGLTASAGLQTAVLCLSAGNEVIADSVACLASSEAFKENIAPSDMGLETVMALKPIVYKYKATGNDRFDNAPNQQAIHAGFSAEQAAAVDRRLVAYDVEGKVRTVRPDAIPAALVKAVQTLKADNDNLRARLERLEAR